MNVFFCMILAGLVLLVQNNEAWKRQLKKIPIKYYVIGLLLSFAGSFLEVFLHVFDENMNVLERDALELSCLILKEFLYFFAVVLAIINESRIRYRKNSQFREKHIGMLLDYYHVQEENIREMRKIRHDIKNHMDVVENYLEQGDIHKAYHYLGEIGEYMNKRGMMPIDVGNELVNAVIMMEQQKMSKKIKFLCEGHVPNLLEINDFELCTIFSNLLSNAREACERLEGEKWIKLKIMEHEEKMIISISNPSEQLIDINNLGKTTTKSDVDNHGFGLSNIIDVVKEHQGEIFFDADEHIFKVQIKI